MENDQDRKEDFFVRMPLLEGVKIIKETRRAYTLYFWYIARVTVEWVFRGVRCGGVHRGIPYTDQRIADDLGSYGANCTADQIRKWRRQLIRKGLIVCKRTPVGHRTMVVRCLKFPGKTPEPIPQWAAKSMERALFEGMI